ncbi:MAG TPA: hypothetical protein VHB51_04345 [Candidatus Saccharimonadales bacterium]|nr:hypothetical protein [Candidatus Saccharimonadales bacterium]
MQPADTSLEQQYQEAVANQAPAVLSTPPVSASQRRSPKLSLFSYNKSALRFTTRAGVVMLLIALGTIGINLTHADSNKSDTSSSQNYPVSNLSLNGVGGAKNLNLGQASQLTINGQLEVNSSIVLEPITQPSAPVAGEIYFDKTTKAPYYYNGKQFVSLAPTTGINGATGAISLGSGLTLVDNKLSIDNSVLNQGGDGGTTNVTNVTNAIGVSSLQGLTGDLNLVAGAGINISGMTITNTGLTSLNAGTGIGVSGNTITNNGVVGLSSSDSTVTINSLGGGQFDLTVAGIGGGVTSLDSQTGALSLSNSSASGSTITIDDASTTQKGIAQFDSTSFAAASGTISLKSTGVTAATYGDASHTVVLNVNAQGQLTTANSVAIAIGGGQIVSGTVGDSFLSSNVAKYNDATANFTGTNLQHNGNTVCDASGNCVGTGGSGSAIGGGGTVGTVPIFSGTGFTIGNSALSQSAGNLTATGGLTLQGSNSLTLGTAGPAGKTGSIAFKNSTNTNTITLQSGASAGNFSLTLPIADGTAGQCLSTNGLGALSFANCLSGSGGGSGGVTNLDGLSGSLAIANSSGVGTTITIDNASTTQKGIAQFDSNSFTAASGLISLSANVARYADATANFTGVLQQSGNNVCTTAGNCTVGGGIGPGSAFTQGGNAFGATGVLGTTDNFGLNIKTHNINALSIDTSQNLTAAANVTVQGGGLTLGVVGTTAGQLMISSVGTGGSVTVKTAAGQVAGVSASFPVIAANDTICLQTLGNCSGVNAGGGDTSYIFNQTAQQTSANINIQARSASVAATIQGASGQDIVDLVSSTGATVAKFDGSAQLTLGIVGSVAGKITVAGAGAGGSFSIQSDPLQANATALTLPADTNANDILCLKNLNNCAGSGIAGSGTAGQVAYFNTSTSLSSSSLMTINTATSTVTLSNGSTVNSNDSLTVPGGTTWQQTPDIAACDSWGDNVRGSVTYNNYIYVICSISSSYHYYYATINPSTGALGSWTDGGVVSSGTVGDAVAVNGYMYVAGGGTMQYAQINANGSLGAFTPSGQAFGSPRANISMTNLTISGSDYIYVLDDLGGLYYDKINSSTHDVNAAWSTATASVITGVGPLVTDGSHLYMVGGHFTTVGTQNTYYTTPNSSTGNVSSWTAGTSLPIPEAEAFVTVSNGYIYVIGSNNINAIGYSYSAAINAGSGAIGSWQWQPGLPINFYANSPAHNTPVANGYIYLVDGFSGGSASPTNSIYYAQAPITYTASASAPSSLAVTSTGVGVGQASPGYLLDVNGDINSSTGLRIGGNLVCTAQGCLGLNTSGSAGGGGGALTLQDAYNNGADGKIIETATQGSFILQAYSGQSSDLLDLSDASGNPQVTFDTAGNISTIGTVTVKKTSTTALKITDGSNNIKFVIDTNNGRVGINTGATAPGTNLTVNGGNNVNPAWPDGIVGTPVAEFVSSPGNTYTVPAGKTLYISAAIVNAPGSGGNNFSVAGVNLGSTSTTSGNLNLNFGAPVPVAAGQTITASSYGASFVGLLVNAGVTPIARNVSSSGSYTVPAGKTLYIAAAIVNAPGSGGNNFSVAGVNMGSTNTSSGDLNLNFGAPVPVASGETVTAGSYGASFVGYLTNSNGYGGP